MPPKPVLALIALALVGHGARLALLRPGAAAGGIEILTASPRTHASPAAHKDSIAAVSRPLADGERINLDHATVPEIARLPRVGVTLAKRIVADRAAKGAFGSLEGLDRVAGIGPGLLRALEPHVAFTPGRPAAAVMGPTATRSSGSDVIVGVPLTHQGVLAGSGSSLSWLNRATAAELNRLPGIGRTRAAAIVLYREQHGPFASLADLGRVPGINPAQVQRLYDHLQVP